MQPTKFTKYMRVWAKDGDGREWLGEVCAVWIRLNDVIYRVYVYTLNDEYEIRESDLRECDEVFEGDEEHERTAANA